MDTEVIKTVEQLRQEVDEIRKLGRTWGFKDDEIDECLTDVLDVVSKSLPTSKESTRSRGKFRNFFRYLTYGFLTVLAFIAAVSIFVIVLSMSDDKSVAFIAKALAGVSYPILRFFRLTFLPIHGMFNVTDYYSSECLVDNPYFDEAPDSCLHCQYKKGLKEIKSNSSAIWRDELQVAVYRDVLTEDLRFPDLQKILRNNKEILREEQRYMMLNSNRSYINSLEDVIKQSEEELLVDRGFHLEWKTSQSLAANRIIRQFFGRPSFVRTTCEISFEKMVIIQSPGTAPFQLPIQPLMSSWYSQISGARQLKIRPTSNCEEKCRTYDVTLKAGDAVVYIPTEWHIWLQPSESNEVSIGYMGSFAQL